MVGARYRLDTSYTHRMVRQFGLTLFARITTESVFGCGMSVQIQSFRLIRFQ